MTDVFLASAKPIPCPEHLRFIYSNMVIYEYKLAHFGNLSK